MDASTRGDDSLLDSFQSDLQRRIARIAAGYSSLRNQGPPGMIKAAQEHLATEVEIARFVQDSPDSYATVLDDVTDEMTNSVQGLQWGSARKVLNIFIRDCLYDIRMSMHASLHAARSFMEVPLDSQVALWLARQAKHRRLKHVPATWTTIIGLQPEESKVYQAVAEEIANQENFPSHGLGRVDLDVSIWGNRGANAINNTGQRRSQSKTTEI